MHGCDRKFSWNIYTNILRKFSKIAEDLVMTVAKIFPLNAKVEKTHNSVNTDGVIDFFICGNRIIKKKIVQLEVLVIQTWLIITLVIPSSIRRVVNRMIDFPHYSKKYNKKFVSALFTRALGLFCRFMAHILYTSRATIEKGKTQWSQEPNFEKSVR